MKKSKSLEKLATAKVIGCDQEYINSQDEVFTKDEISPDVQVFTAGEITARDYANFMQNRERILGNRGFSLRERTSKHEVYTTELGDCYAYIPINADRPASPFMVQDVNASEISQIVEDYDSLTHTPTVSNTGVSAIVSALGFALGLFASSECGMNEMNTVKLTGATTIAGSFIGIGIGRLREKAQSRKCARLNDTICEIKQRGYQPVFGKRDFMDYFSFISTQSGLDLSSH